MAIIPKGAVKSVVQGAKTLYNDAEETLVNAIKPVDLQRKDNLTPNEVNTISTQLAPEKLAKQALENTQLGRVVDPARHEARNFSLDSIDSTEDIKALMDSPHLWADNGVGSLSTDPKNKQTHEETLNKAFEKSQTVNQWLKKGTGPRTADEIVRGKQLLMLGAMEIAEASKDVLTSPGDLQKAYRHRALIGKQAALYHAFTGAATEAGRSVNAFKIAIGNDDRMFAQMEEMMLQTGGTATSKKMAEAILSLGDDFGRITDFAVQNKYKRKTQAINEWISASHLWQPTTHAANVLGNVSATITGVGERYLATGIGRARKALGVGSEVDRVTIEESNAMMQGMIEGIISAPKIFAKAWRDHEKNPDFLMSKGAVKVDGYFKPSISAENLLGENMNSPLGKTIDALAPHLIRTPFRMLGSADEVFKTMNYNMQSYAHARRALAQEGMEHGSKEYNQRMQRILSGEDEVYSQVINDQSIDYAEMSTFTNSLTDQFSQGVQKAASSSPLIKMFLPYVRTPTNIMKYATERTLLAPATKQWRDQWNKGGAERDIATAKVLLGSTIQAGFVYLAMNTEQVETANGIVEVPRPLVTGAYPKSRKMQNVWKENGIQPWSIYYDGAYHAYNRADPIGMQIGMAIQGVAVAQSFYTAGERENAFASVSIGLGEYYSEKAYFQSLGEMFNLFDGEKSAISNMQRIVGQKTASTLIPSHMSWLAKQADNGFVATTQNRSGKNIEHKFGTPEELETFMEKNPEATVSEHPMNRNTKTSGFMNNIVKQLQKRSPLPGKYGRKDLKLQVDMFGNDVIMDNLTWHSFNMSAARYSEVEHDDVVANELFEQGFGYMTPDSKLNVHINNYDRSVDLDLVAIDPSGELFYQWQKMVGKERYGLLRKTISSPRYRSMTENSDEKQIGRRYWLQKAAREGRVQAAKKFHLKYAKELQTAGIELINSVGGGEGKPYKGPSESSKLEPNQFQ